MKFTDKSVIEFAECLSSKEPVPGGGGASALVGALGTSLGAMVGQLTVGKKKYADVEADIKVLIEKAEVLQEELLNLVEKDAEVFEPLIKAYRMPKETEEEKAEKARVIELVLKDAARVPLEIMEKCCQAIELQREFAEKGSSVAISDAGAGVIFAKAALQGASLNVFINTASMTDRACAAELEDKAERMLMEYTVEADEIYASVYNRLRKQQ